MCNQIFTAKATPTILVVLDGVIRNSCNNLGMFAKSHLHISCHNYLAIKTMWNLFTLLIYARFLQSCDSNCTSGIALYSKASEWLKLSTTAHSHSQKNNIVKRTLWGLVKLISSPIFHTTAYFSAFFNRAFRFWQMRSRRCHSRPLYATHGTGKLRSRLRDEIDTYR